MAVNKHFHTNGVSAIASEQSLYADLVAEAIHHRGHSVYYLDRTLVAEDTVLGEDSLSKFNKQSLIEMYMEDSGGGFAGQQELMTQFGLQNLSEATFVVSKTKFQEKTKQIQLEDGTDSSESGSVQLESGTVTDSTISYILNETDATDSDRPFEGDAIYHPVLKKLFQINFVDHDDPFNQLDSNPVYKMRCRLFDYSSDEFSTGITDIDTKADENSLDAFNFQFSLETATDGGTGALILENNDGTDDGNTYYLIQESYSLATQTDDFADNDTYDSQAGFNSTSVADDILDFTERNPFGDADNGL